MTSLETLQRIKMLTISALVADDILMGILVLKGGNALDLAYDIRNKEFSEKWKLYYPKGI